MNKSKPKKPTVARKGLVITYIGDGKGKTSAGLGVAVRAAGAGMNVFILQFVKAQKPEGGEKLQGGEWPLSNEINFFDSVNQYHPLHLSQGYGGLVTPSFGKRGNVGTIETEQCGKGFVGILGDQKDRDTHVREALRGLERAREVMLSGEYQLIIFDELISALELKLIEERDILELISLKPEFLHMVMTGHKRFKNIIAASDLVTEMKMIKHPYYEGILAQRGIDF